MGWDGIDGERDSVCVCVCVCVYGCVNVRVFCIGLTDWIGLDWVESRGFVCMMMM